VDVTLESDDVACYSGYNYATSPRGFRWEGVWHRVREVKKAWQEPGRRCFLVLTEVDRLFQLCYSEAEDRWRLAEVMNS